MLKLQRQANLAKVQSWIPSPVECSPGTGRICFVRCRAVGLVTVFTRRLSNSFRRHRVCKASS